MVSASNGAARSTAEADITDWVVSLDKMSLEGSGRVSSAQLMLNANRGRFITKSTGADRRIDRMARLDISVGAMPFGTGAHTHRYVVTRLEPQRTPDGTQLQVELMGIEWLLRQVLVTGHYYFQTYADILADISRQAQKVPGVPSISALPAEYAYAAGNMDFRDGTDAYGAAMQVLSALNVSVAAGGVGDILSLTPSTAAVSARRLGSRNAATADADKVVIAATDDGFLECQQTHEPEEGTHIVVRGQQDFGSLPVDWAIWRSALETFANYPEFVSTRAYPEGARVRHGAGVWERTDHMTQDTPAAASMAWDEIFVKDIVGRTFDYSPWTRGRDEAYRNMASRPDQAVGGTSFDAPAFPDSNLVVRDGNDSDTFWRSWAHFRQNLSSPGLNINEVRYSQADADAHFDGRRWPEGTRVLFGATRTGSDAYGNPYANALVTRTEAGAWLVIATPTPAAGFGRIRVNVGDEVAVLHEGRVYEWTRQFGSKALRDARARSTTGTPAWRDITASALGNDCFHRPASIRNVPGFHGAGHRRDPASDLATQEYAYNSAVEVRYDFGVTDDAVGAFASLAGALGSIVSTIGGIITGQRGFLETISLGKYGWWVTLFEAPMPKSTRNSAGSVGGLFRSGVLDAYNLNPGTSGYGQDDITGQGAGTGTAALNIGETSGIQFTLNFVESVAGAPVPFQGDFPFRITVYDTEDNVWVHDFNYRIQGEPQRITAPWSAFRIYRARAPHGIRTALLNVLLPERLELERLETRKIKMITLQFQRPYDEPGRFAPWADWGLALRNLVSFASGATFSHTGTIDALSFIKPEYRAAWSAQAGRDRILPIGARLMPPVREYPRVSNSQQLEAIASSELAVALHRTRSYTIKLKGRTDVNLDDTIFYRDADTVTESDMGANTKRLAVTRVTHSAATGSGWLTTLECVDRIAD